MIQISAPYIYSTFQLYSICSSELCVCYVCVCYNTTCVLYKTSLLVCGSVGPLVRSVQSKASSFNDHRRTRKKVKS